MREAARTVLGDAANAYFFERLPTKSTLLKTSFQRSHQTKEILDDINKNFSEKAKRVDKDMRELKEWIDSW